MKKITLIILFISMYNILYAQTFNDQKEIITFVSLLFEKENVTLYYKIRNEHYEGELELLKDNNSESKILKYFDIDYKTLKKNYRKTNLHLLSKYYNTKTTKNLKEENIAVLSIPIFSNNGEKAILYGRFSCGLFCGRINIFYFVKKDSNWFLSNIEELK